MSAYGEFRSSFNNDPNDHRIIFYGLRYILDTYICRRWTKEDLQATDSFLSTHNTGHTAYPYPRELFRRIVEECGGYFPVRICALPEGSIIYPHVPVYVITASGEYSGLVTFLETVLTMYPSTVATLSRRCRDLIEDAFALSADSADLVDSRLHDFGFRGCSTVEQAVVGGAAHLLNFSGSDTMPAAFYVQTHLNNGIPVAASIPATEHSVMTAFSTETDAILHAISIFGNGVYACVMDSYDYCRALETVLPAVAAYKVQKGGVLILRPDSGEPVEMVLRALHAAANVFKADANSKGYLVLRGAGVIHGDGITYDQIRRILKAVCNAGFSAQNVAFGMGSNLLHRINRDTMSFATKLCHIVDSDGNSRDVCKRPKTDPTKFSLPGLFSVRHNIPIVYPKEKSPEHDEELLQVWYDHGPVESVPRPSFSEISKKIKENWPKMPLKHQSLSPALLCKMNQF